MRAAVARLRNCGSLLQVLVRSKIKLEDNLSLVEFLRLQHNLLGDSKSYPIYNRHGKLAFRSRYVAANSHCQRLSWLEDSSSTTMLRAGSLDLVRCRELIMFLQSQQPPHTHPHTQLDYLKLPMAPTNAPSPRSLALQAIRKRVTRRGSVLERAHPKLPRA